MSDPMQQRPIDPPPPVDSAPKRTSPIVWLLLLAVLLALAWYFYNRNAVDVTDEAALPPPVTDIASPDAMTPGAATAPPVARKAAKPARKPEPPAVSSDREPQPIARLQPEYPPAAFRAGEEGTVVVRADIDAQGKPVSVTVATSSRSRDLDRAAVNAVRKWSFQPARRDGQAVAATVEVPIDFRLERQ